MFDAMHASDDEKESKKCLCDATFIKLMKILVCYKKEHDEHIFCADASQTMCTRRATAELLFFPAKK